MRTATPRHRFEVLLAAAGISAAFLVAACSADQYRRDADHEVGEIIDQKEERLFGKASGFTIETARDTLRTDVVAELARLRAERHDELLREVLPPAKEVRIGPEKKAATDPVTGEVQS